jgi:photosystem II stability/assembly factor-like uncharacterized protein
MSSIFISYRRGGAPAHARAVFERLRNEFGSGEVFIDVEGIDFGLDFVEILSKQLNDCQVILALIDPQWATALDTQGRRRIDREHDYVRTEIVMALARGILTIPVLIDGAVMPDADDLPEPLRPLSRRNALVLDFTNFDAEIGRLIAAIKKIVVPSKNGDKPATDGATRIAHEAIAEALHIRSEGEGSVPDPLDTTLHEEIEGPGASAAEKAEIRKQQAISAPVLTADSERKPIEKGSWRRNKPLLLMGLVGSASLILLLIFQSGTRQPSTQIHSTLPEPDRADDTSKVPGAPSPAAARSVASPATDSGSIRIAQGAKMTNKPQGSPPRVVGQPRQGVSDRNSIAATTETLNTWTAQTSNTTHFLFRIAFTADGQRGWAVGTGVIVATTDGGKTWTTQTINTPTPLLGMTLSPDGQNLWAVGQDGTIVETTDGGRVWSARPGYYFRHFIGVALNANGQRIWGVGDGGTIIATTDGGNTWKAQISKTKRNLWAITFTADGKRGWAVGDGGTIIATTDGGNTWVPQTGITTNDLKDITFTADGQRGWAVGDSGTIIATTNAGKTWKAQISNLEEPGRHTFFGVAFAVDGQRGFAVGSLGGMVATTDGGNTWKVQQGNKGGNSLFGIALTADGRRAWVVGDNGTIMATADATSLHPPP